MPYRSLTPHEARAVIADPFRKVWRLTFTNPFGKRDFILVEAATGHAVRAWAQRDLVGYTDFIVGRYMGSLHARPTRNVQRRATRNA